MVCENCVKKAGTPYYRCKLTNDMCPWQRWCPTERKTVMTDMYKKYGCKIKKNYNKSISDDINKKGEE